MGSFKEKKLKTQFPHQNNKGRIEKIKKTQKKKKKRRKKLFFYIFEVEGILDHKENNFSKEKKDFTLSVSPITH